MTKRNYPFSNHFSKFPTFLNGSLNSFMRIILFFLFTFCAFSSFSQVEIHLEAGNYPFHKTNDYRITRVEDARPSAYFLGKVYLRNSSKTDLLLAGGTEKAFLNHLNENLKMDKNGKELMLRIPELSVTETPGSNRLIDGRIQLKLEAYALFDGKEILICHTRSSSKFNRSYGTAHEKAYEPLIRSLWSSCLNYVNNYIDENKYKLEAFNQGSQIIFKPYQTRNSGDTVHYASRRVTWNDFKGPVRNRSGYAAAIFTSIGLQTELRIIDRKLTATIRPQVFMIPSQSWAKPAGRSREGLEHEQLHFDITQVVMNRLIERLKLIEAGTMDDLHSQIQYEYLEAFKEMNRLQEEYDSESNHNLNSPGQLKWKLKVSEWLSPRRR